jgi:hypothetical protein
MIRGNYGPIGKLIGMFLVVIVVFAADSFDNFCESSI